MAQRDDGGGGEGDKRLTVADIPMEAAVAARLSIDRQKASWCRPSPFAPPLRHILSTEPPTLLHHVRFTKSSSPVLDDFRL